MVGTSLHPVEHRPVSKGLGASNLFALSLGLWARVLIQIVRKETPAAHPFENGQNQTDGTKAEDKPSNPMHVGRLGVQVEHVKGAAKC